MTRIPKSLKNADAQSLAAFLDSSKRPEGTLRFHELQGFLFAIASSPETIPPSEWLSLVSNDEEFGFTDENEAQQVLTAIMTLYNDINTVVLERSKVLPPGCNFEDDVFANFDDKASISQWSQGFLIGHDWLSEVWEEYLPEEMDEECGATVMVLSFFSSRQLAKVYIEDGSSHRSGSEASLQDFAEKTRELFPAALASYAHIGRTIFEFLLENISPDETRH